MKLDVRAIDDKGLPEKPFPSVRHQELRIVIDEAAFDHTVARGATDTTREVGGVLVGDLARDAAGPYLHVQATIDALHAEEKGAELTFTHKTWEHIHGEIDKSHKGKKIVGWWHTHPGFGVFLSDRDQFIHKSFFDLPFQIALVYDPKSREHGVFAWREGEPARARRYFLGTHEHTWDGPRTVEKGRKEGKETKDSKERSDERPAASPSSSLTSMPAMRADPGPLVSRAGLTVDWTFLGVGAAILIALGALGGWWLGTRSSTEALTQARIEVAQAEARGMQVVLSQINPALLGTIRAALDGTAERPIEQALVALDDALNKLVAVLPKDASLTDPLARVVSARNNLAFLLNQRQQAGFALLQLEQLLSQRNGVDPRDIGTMRHALASLYADLAADAAKAGDVKRARRMYAAASGLDPAGAARYQKELDALPKDPVAAPVPDAGTK